MRNRNEESSAWFQGVSWAKLRLYMDLGMITTLGLEAHSGYKERGQREPRVEAGAWYRALCRSGWGKAVAWVG